MVWKPFVIAERVPANPAQLSHQASSNGSHVSKQGRTEMAAHEKAETLLFHHAQGQTPGFLAFADEPRAAEMGRSYP